MSDDKTLSKKVMKKVEKSFENFLNKTGEDRVVLIKSRSGRIFFLIGEKPFSVRYRSTKYPEGKLEFSTEDEALEDWVYNVNDVIEKNWSLEKALVVAVELYAKLDDVSDEFGSMDDDFGSMDDDFGSFDDFDEMDLGDMEYDDADMDDISMMPDELDLIRMKKRWRDKEEELRSIKESEREILRKKNESQYKRNEEDKVEQIFTSSAASGVLTNDLLNIMEHSGTLGFSAEAVDDNIYHWTVRISKFENRDMKRQMTELEETFGYNFVELDIEFTLDLYPFYPPLVKVVRPRFQGFMMGRITSLDILKLENWDPIKNMGDIVGLIREMIDENARLDLTHEMNNLVEFPDGAYTKLEHLLLELDLLSDIDSRSIKKYPIQEEIVKGRAVKKTEKKEETSNPTGSNYWAKGTGYGYSGASSESWNVEAYLAAQKEKDIQYERVMTGIKIYLQEKLNDLPEDGQILQALVLEESCLIPSLERYFDNDSLLDMSRHESLYVELFDVASALANNTHTCLLLDTLPQQRRSILRHLKNLDQAAKLYENAVSKGGSSDIQEESILVTLIKKTYQFANDRIESEKKEDRPIPLYMMGWDDLIVEVEDELDQQGRNDEEYLEIMGDLQFGHADLMGNEYNHFYKSQSGTSSSKEKILRIAQETGSLATSLPLNVSSSVFVRMDEDRIDYMSALIIGPEDTPYSGGCFSFDIHFPQVYPNGPPLVWLRTTGGDTFRFNPNLYANGKVCLSLLGTWSGSQGENWNKDTSTLLQVLVSIQSLIMVPDPYFNEPGYERSMGTPSGDRSNKDYNANIREGCIRYAMIGQLRNPRHGYEDVIQNHFRLQKKRILKQAKLWRQESKGGSHYNKMVTLVQELEAELNQLS